MSQNSKSDWFSATVVKGKGLAKKLEYPTLNLDKPWLLSGNKEGVYACRVKIRGNTFKGVLYFGPRLILGETEKILEIFVFDFDKEIYGEIVSFQVLNFIRGVQNFPNFNAFKQQLELDCQKAKEILK